MKRYYFFSSILFAGLICLFSSCINCIEATGEMKTKELQLAPFEKLDINLPAIVQIRVGEVPSIRITAPGNVFKALQTPVRNNTLILETMPCINSNNDDIRVELKVNNLNSIEINGSANVKVYDSLKVDYLKLKINGSGRLVADIFANQVDFNVNGSGEAIVSGTTRKLEIKINGSGEFRGLDLMAYDAKIKVSGSGNADIYVLNKLRASVQGSGDVRYSGNPQVKTNISGSGSVTKMK